MKRRLNQAGVATWELALAVLVLAVVAFAGYRVYNANQTSSTTKTVTSADTKAVTNTPAAPNVNTTSDLDSASAALDQVDPSASNTSDSSQLSSQTNF